MLKSTEIFDSFKYQLDPNRYQKPPIKFKIEVLLLLWNMTLDTQLSYFKTNTLIDLARI